MVTHLGCKNNDGTMRGLALCQCQGPVVKTLFAKWGGVWLAVTNVLDDYNLR